MKTLNRTLSLTLVFALVFSLMSFAFAADTTATTTTKAPKLSDFTDADKLTYTEAADYLIAAGVVKGETATTLNPKGDFTRAQAAKLIAYAALGQTAADNLKVSVSPFKDVDASNWAAGYIAYCQKQGFVNGYGDGNFGPNDKVTGYQMAKMLLCSLGYGVNSEFTGSGWELAVAPLALSYGIFNDNPAGASAAAATREEAFLYTFNTLGRLCNVSYNKNLAVYYVPGREAIATNPASVKADRSDTLGYQRFKMAWVSSDGTYSESAHYWAINGKKVTAPYPNDPITKLASAADGTPYDKLTSKGTAKYIGYSADDVVNYYINGDVQTTTEAGKTVPNSATVKAAASVRGNVVNFYDTDKNGKYDTVEVLVYKVAKLTAAPTVRTGGGNSVVTMTDLVNGYNKPLKDIVDDYIDGDFASLKKDDYVLYYANKAGTSWTIEKCATVTGQLYGYNDTAYALNVNGTNYNASTISTNFAASTADATAAFAKAWKAITDTKGLAGTTFYLDAGKNICAAEPTQNVVAAGNVVYVLDAGQLAGAYSARVLKADGTVSLKNVAQIIGVDGTVKAASAIAKNDFYTFVENKDGSLTLTEISGTVTTVAASQADETYTGATAGDMVFKKGAANFFFKSGATSGEAVKGTDKTVFVLEREADIYTAYTGVSAIPNVKVSDAKDTKAYVLQDKDGYAIMAVALKGKLDAAYNVSGYVATFTDPSLVTKTSNANDYYYSYPYAVVNGEIKTFDSTYTQKLDAGLYAVNGYENDKVASVVTETADKAQTRLNNTINGLAALGKTATGFDVVDNNVTVKGDAETSFLVTKDVKVFVFDAYDKASNIVSLDKLGAIGAIENLRGDAFTVMGLSVSDKDATINELYITIMPKGAGAPVTTPGVWTSVSGTTYSVDYYAQTGWTTNKAVDAVKADLVANGWTVADTTLSGGIYTFDVVKVISGASFTKQYTLPTANVKEVVKVTATIKADTTGFAFKLGDMTAASLVKHGSDLYVAADETTVTVKAVNTVATDAIVNVTFAGSSANVTAVAPPSIAASTAKDTESAVAFTITPDAKDVSVAITLAK